VGWTNRHELGLRPASAKLYLARLCHANADSSRPQFVSCNIEKWVGFRGRVYTGAEIMLRQGMYKRAGTECSSVLQRFLLSVACARSASWRRTRKSQHIKWVGCRGLLERSSTQRAAKKRERNLAFSFCIIHPL